MLRPCTVSGLGALSFEQQGNLGAYAIDTTDYFGDASDLNAAPPPPPAPPLDHTPLIIVLTVGAWFLWKGKS